MLSLDLTQLSIGEVALFDIESPDYVIQSLMNIREKLTAVLQELSEGSSAAEPIRAMRTACTEHLTIIHAGWQRSQEMQKMPDYDWTADPFGLNYLLAIGQLRTEVGHELLELTVKFGIEIHEPLAKIVPGKPETVESQYQEAKAVIEKSIANARQTDPESFDAA